MQIVTATRFSVPRLCPAMSSSEETFPNPSGFPIPTCSGRCSWNKRPWVEINLHCWHWNYYLGFKYEELHGHREFFLSFQPVFPRSREQLLGPCRNSDIRWTLPFSTGTSWFFHGYSSFSTEKGWGWIQWNHSKKSPKSNWGNLYSYLTFSGKFPDTPFLWNSLF